MRRENERTVSHHGRFSIEDTSLSPWLIPARGNLRRASDIQIVRFAGRVNTPLVDTLLSMPRGYMEGPASEEREAELERLERPQPPRPEERPAVYGSTADEPEKHFIGWLDDVDPDELFASGEAWGISVMRRAV
jgi:hypothetical protein